MRSTLSALLLPTLLVGCASSQPEERPAPAPVAVDAEALKAELQAFLDVQAADWTEGDLEGFCAVYAEDAVFISPSGKTVGRQAIFDRYTKRYREDGAEMGTLTLTVEDVRLSPSGDMAAIAMRWALAWAAKDPASGLSLITLVRQGPTDVEGRPGWQIVQDASM
jgi:ketosteroid isomerase-like protein